MLGYFVYSESYRHNPICTCLTKEDITLPLGGGICSPPCLLPQWTHCSEAEHSSLEKHCSPAGTCGSPLPCEPALTNQKSAFTSVTSVSQFCFFVVQRCGGLGVGRSSEPVAKYPLRGCFPLGIRESHKEAFK